MRPSIRLALAAAAIAAGGLSAAIAAGAPSIAVLVLKEHGVGSAAQAQPHLNQLLAATAQQNGWPAAHGSYETTRSGAEAFIQSDKPDYGIFSLPAFLALRQKHSLDPIGHAVVSTGGGQQYFVVSQSAASLADCKGKRLVSDHADDTRFIDNVVAAGAFKLSEFTVVQVPRPSQPIKELVGGAAECALIDDAQLVGAQKVGGIKQLWSSAKLPAMVIVAFKTAPPAQRAAFQGNLGKICQGATQTVCAQIGLQSLNATPAQLYAPIIARY